MGLKPAPFQKSDTPTPTQEAKQISQVIDRCNGALVSSYRCQLVSVVCTLAWRDLKGTGL
jgi:hypothetical protein